MTYILLYVFLWGCTKDIYQPSVFTAETLPVELEEKHCPIGTELRKISYTPSSEGSNYCWDPIAKTKHGPFLSWDITGRWYFHYEKGRLSHIPIFLTPTNNEDQDRLHSFMLTHNDAQLLQTYLEQLKDEQQKQDIHLRLFSMGKLDVSYFFPQPLPVDDCQNDTAGMQCVLGGIFSYQQGEANRVFYRAFEEPTFYADITPITTEQIYNCRTTCGCPGVKDNGPMLSWTQANAYCRSQNKQSLHSSLSHATYATLSSPGYSHWTNDSSCPPSP